MSTPWHDLADSRRLGEFFIPGRFFEDPEEFDCLMNLLCQGIILEQRHVYDPSGFKVLAYHPQFAPVGLGEGPGDYFLTQRYHGDLSTFDFYFKAVDK